MYTEAEAKTKWCPLARASDIGNQPVSINRSGRNPDADCLCLASACMSWRWYDGLNEDGTIKWFVSLSDNSAQWTTNRPETRRGFCGAFGPAKAGAA